MSEIRSIGGCPTSSCGSEHAKRSWRTAVVYLPLAIGFIVYLSISYRCRSMFVSLSPEKLSGVRGQ